MMMLGYSARVWRVSAHRRPVVLARACVCVSVCICVTSLLLPFNSIITKHTAPPVEREKVQVRQVSSAKMEVCNAIASIYCKKKKMV